VLDLKPGDFSSARKARHKPSTACDWSAASRVSFAVFLDEYHVDASATSRVREAVARFVDQDLAPTDLLVVMKPLDSILTIRLTTDRADAHRAIEAFEGGRATTEPRNTYEREFMAGTPPRIEAARIQVALSAINALTLQLGSMGDRRKTLVVVTRRSAGRNGAAGRTCRHSTRSSAREPSECLGLSDRPWRNPARRRGRSAK
jgi:hypothetical protein